MKARNKTASRPLLAAAAATALLLGTLGVSLTGCQPRAAQHLVETGAMDDPVLARGQTLFMFHCNQCHPAGLKGLGPGIIDKPLPRPLMATQVRAGLGVMPHFNERQISNSDLDAITKYIAARHHEFAAVQ